MKIDILKALKAIDRKIKRNLNNSEAFKNDEILTSMKGYLIGYIFGKSLEKEDVFQKDIEKQFRISKATCSEIIANMEHDGYIKRIVLSEDARCKRIVLTELGLKTHMLVDEALFNIQEEMMSEFSNEEREQLLAFLARMEAKL